MLSWSAKRKFIYGSIFIIVVSLVVSSLFYKIFYHVPTCSDGLKNGDEAGIDCGGGCKNICTTDALEPVVLWAKTFNISGDVYSVVAYIENPNVNSKNAKVEYQFSIFDENNKIITVKDGETSIPKGKKFAIFENGIILKGAKPKRTELNFISFSNWQKDETPEPKFDLTYSQVLESSTTPHIDGNIKNTVLFNVPQIELDAFVMDANQNAIAASRTFVDNLGAGQSNDFVFTWPKPFSLIPSSVVVIYRTF